jgi:hypothetical protein
MVFVMVMRTQELQVTDMDSQISMEHTRRRGPEHLHVWLIWMVMMTMDIL